MALILVHCFELFVFPAGSDHQPGGGGVHVSGRSREFKSSGSTLCRFIYRRRCCTRIFICWDESFRIKRDPQPALNRSRC